MYTFVHEYCQNDGNRNLEKFSAEKLKITEILELKKISQYLRSQTLTLRSQITLNLFQQGY
jgi:hypothetical protein